VVDVVVLPMVDAVLSIVAAVGIVVVSMVAACVPEAKVLEAVVSMVAGVDIVVLSILAAVDEACVWVAGELADLSMSVKFVAAVLLDAVVLDAMLPDVVLLDASGLEELVATGGAASTLDKSSSSIACLCCTDDLKPLASGSKSLISCDSRATAGVIPVVARECYVKSDVTVL